MAVDNHVERMVEELRAALVEAIRSSDEISDAVQRIRREGFSLQLMLSCERDRAPELGREVGVDSGIDSRRSQSARQEIGLDSRSSSPLTDSVETRRAEPSFRLNGQDVSFLQSMGIDATRPGRSRRRRRNS